MNTRRPWIYLSISLLIIHHCGSLRSDSDHFLNQFAIRLKSGGRQEAEEIATRHGFRVTRELTNSNVFVLEHPIVHHRSKRRADNELTSLLTDNKIAHAQQEVALTRVKRTIMHDKQLELPIRTIEDDSVFFRFSKPSFQQRDNIDRVGPYFADPKFKDMWYLVNQGQSGGEEGLDMNVAVAWENGLSGVGIVVCILDDGIDHTHPDLVHNFDSKASTDLNDRSDFLGDPMPNTSKVYNSHGTRCAGEIAAEANNNVCGIGVAFNARIGGVRILDGTVTDALEAEALTFNNNYIDIYSASWGPNDDGSTMEGPRKLALEALQTGVIHGRNGKGSIYVWATGNGGMNEDDCSADGYVSRPETLSVGSVTDWGKSPFFMENCTSTFAVVPSGGEEYQGQEKEEGKVKLKVITTDMNGGCIENFQGTSSAAPLAAGCLANVLQANPNLTWRDVQHIVVRGTRIPSADTSWTINGAGHHVSHKFGFGLMDCGRMVELAQKWNNVPERLLCNTTRHNYQILPRNGKLTDVMVITGCDEIDGKVIDRLEHVEVYVEMSTEYRGHTKIVLTSPSGTRSVLLSPRSKDKYNGEWEFSFMTVHSWDEYSVGKWTLEIYDTPSNDERNYKHVPDHVKGQKTPGHTFSDVLNTPSGFIKVWSLALYGTHGTRYDRSSVNSSKKEQAYIPTANEILTIKKKEVKMAKRVEVKRGSIIKKKQEIVSENKSDDKLMKELWNLLHKHGGREMQKRVLNTSSNDNDISKQKISRSSKLSHNKSPDDLPSNELIEELIDLLEQRLEREHV